MIIPHEAGVVEHSGRALSEGLSHEGGVASGGSGSRGYGKVAFTSLAIDGESLQAQFDAVPPFSIAP